MTRKGPSSSAGPRRWLLFALLMPLALLQGCSFMPGFGMREEPLPLPSYQRHTVEAHSFTLGPNDEVLGEMATVPLDEGDTLSDLARHYGLGYQQIADANPEYDPWTPPAGSKVLLPLRFILPDAPRKGVVINLANMRLFHFGGKSNLTTYPVGIGREGRASPLGAMTVDRKTPNPTWYVPESIRRDHAKKGDPLPAVVSPGPDNPLGAYALYLSRPSYLIHGTNKPFSIGVRASNGCIRLYPEDIQVLFHDVKQKSQVRIVNQPYLVGVSGNEVYLEAHQPHEELNTRQARATVTSKLKNLEKKQGVKLNWARIAQVLDEARGIPVAVGSPGTATPEYAAGAVALQHPARLTGQPEPVVASNTGQSWYVRAAITEDSNSADKLAAVLNHMGPRIPARAVAKAGRYEVLAGPYADAKSAKLATKQLRIEMEIAGQVIEPNQRLSLRSAP
jgi:L,D-transpeptidase ErfK/SrfK